jgi:hypothetical protein
MKRAAFRRAFGQRHAYSSGMKNLCAFLALLLGASRLGAAEPVVKNDETAAVLQVVQQFFDAMHAQDEAAMRKTFHPNSQFAWGMPAATGYTVKQQTIEAFAKRERSPSAPPLERMWNPTVHLDGRAAVVWARYDFHLGDKFSHNGIDCYVLLKTDDGWKIVSLVFTVELGTKTEHPAGPPN